jgi:hypothetical protein
VLFTPNSIPLIATFVYDNAVNWFLPLETAALPLFSAPSISIWLSEMLLFLMIFAHRLIAVWILSVVAVLIRILKALPSSSNAAVLALLLMLLVPILMGCPIAESGPHASHKVIPTCFRCAKKMKRAQINGLVLLSLWQGPLLLIWALI